MSDLQTELRRAVLIEMKNSPALTALVPAARLYPGKAPPTPTRPFAKTGTMIGSPGPTLAGERIRLPIYAEADEQATETGEDLIGRIVAAIKLTLDRRIIATPSGTAKLRFVNDIRRRSDGTTDSWQANVEFAAKMIA